MSSQQSAVGQPATNRRVLIGSLSGSAIEWFDFFLYATAAALIFDKQFFPNDDPVISLMLSYLSLSLTFFIRPFGGIVFSHIGDRIGRKKTLVITLSMMGGATVAIGLLPTYAQVGVLAPILLILCRVVQGLAIGGEWGGALLLAYEYAPKNRRGFFGSVPQTGVTIGMLLSTIAFALVSMLPDGAFEAWGWRLPFIASLVLVFVGLWIRKGLADTPAFREAKKSGNIAKLPIKDTLRDHWRSVLVAVGAKVVETAPFYIFATFVVSYATGTLDMQQSVVLNAVSAGALVSTISILLMGSLSDRLGRSTVFLGGVVLIAAFAAPFFLLLDLRMNWAVYAAVIISLGVAWPPVTATLGTLTSEIFTTRVRYTGVTLGYQIGAALAGGTAPLLATWLLARFDGAWWPIAAYLVVLAVISFAAVAVSGRVVRKETAAIARREGTEKTEVEA
ncbi:MULTISPECIES: MFS transporter [Nocardiopsis]|uniref:Putative proline/betaine transporter n=2 Tax=Nocardiopsis alba TaxID=53437 RepID=A0A7K2IVZ8_9ACTN|nr:MULTISPECIES: MFS transporter [Nocardiopsis]AFR08396.1 sugar (and other) transporter family protein [Nocardiopsis alba ATCC BAA-2165]MEC3894376.1 MFS transporter [Nocardiopsis sp. LDBS1602]MYR34160.1 MFS transporter [Nocardiopsis alba]